MGNQIEGELLAGQKVVVVEDLVSTGRSSLQAVEAIRAAGAEVIGMCALFTYSFPDAYEAFKKAEVPLKTISDYNALMELAAEQGLIREEDKVTLAQWRTAPDVWGRTS